MRELVGLSLQTISTEESCLTKKKKKKKKRLFCEGYMS